MGGSSSIYCTSMRFLSLKIKCWPWLDSNGSFRDRLFHHSEMEHSRSHNTAIKFHQGSLHADSYVISCAQYNSYLQTHSTKIGILSHILGCCCWCRWLIHKHTQIWPLCPSRLNCPELRFMGSFGMHLLKTTKKKTELHSKKLWYSVYNTIQ